MAKDQAIFDFNNAGVRKTVARYIESLRGLHWFEARRCKDQRSLSQNAYYWGVVLPMVAKGIGETWGETVTSEEAHEFLKRRFLAKPLVNRETGELMGYSAASSAALDIPAFGEYLDNIIKFSAEQLNVEIPISLRAAEVTA